MWITCTGKIEFDPENKTKKHELQSTWKRTAIVLLDKDISLYYSWFIYKRYGIALNQVLRGTHFTIVNDRINTIELTESFESAKKMFDGTEIELSYNVDVRSDGTHWYMPAMSIDAEKIRNQIGLGDPFFNFHVTVGRADNELNNAQSEYILGLIRNGLIS